jgi:ankyrin repeat protein
MYRPLKRSLRDDFDSDEEVLHACIRDGDVLKLRQLLEPTHAHIDHLHPFLGTPLHYAARCGDLDAVELLLAAGADPSLIGNDQLKLTAIGLAAFEGNRDVVRRLWRTDSPQNQLRNLKPHQACLIVAATYGRVAIVQDLLACWDGWPQELKTEALLWAARRWHFSVANLLLNEMEFEQKTLQEALYCSTQLKYMLPHEYNVKCEGVDYLNQQSLIVLLVEAGADPNGSLNNTPLLYSTASNTNLTGALKALLEKGADPIMINRFGHSALHVVASPVGTGQAESNFLNEAAIQLLLNHKGSVSLPDETGETPLHRAALGLDLRLFQLYLSSCHEAQDVQLFLKNHNAETLLHYAAAGCCIETIEFLIAKGLDVNAKNSNGWTPLMCALVPIDDGLRSSTKSPDEAIQAARCLLSYGADAAVSTEEGWTALHGLALYRDFDLCDRINAFAMELISRGADPHTRACLLRPEAYVVVPELGMPWGYRLREAIMDPSAIKMVIGPSSSALFWAAERGAIGPVKALLTHGVDPSSMDGCESSPTRLAAESKFLKRLPELSDRIIKQLLDAGAGF